MEFGAQQEPMTEEKLKYHRAVHHMHRGEWAEAIHLLESLASRHSRDGRIARDLAEARFKANLDAIKPYFYDQKRRRSMVTSSSLAFKYVARTTKVDPDLLGIEARERLLAEVRKQQDQAKLAFAKVAAAEKRLEGAIGYSGRPRSASKGGGLAGAHPQPYRGPAGSVPPNMQPPGQPTPPRAPGLPPVR